MSRIGSDTDIGMNRNSSDRPGMNFNSILTITAFTVVFKDLSRFKSAFPFDYNTINKDKHRK